MIVCKCDVCGKDFKESDVKARIVIEVEGKEVMEKKEVCSVCVEKYISIGVKKTRKRKTKTAE